jgi:hypothetical protein
MLGKVIKPCSRIVKFAFPKIVCAAALPDATEIYPQRCKSRIVKCCSCSKDDLVMHSAAAEWMRMKDQSNSLRRGHTRFFEDCLELTMIDGN